MTNCERIGKNLLKKFLDKGQEFDTAKENAIYGLQSLAEIIAENELYGITLAPFNEDLAEDFLAAALYLKSLKFWKPN
jgi:hypothetical protein